MLLMQLETPQTTPLPPRPDRFLLPQPKQPISRAEVRITLRVRSESPPIRRAKLDENGALVRCEGSNATTAIILRRHSVSTASQYAPISLDQLENARRAIGLQNNDSVPQATCVRDLETAPTKQLPPLHPRSVLPRAVAVSVNQNQAQGSRPLSGNFTSTFLINTSGHACVTRSKSFKTLRRSESTESNPIAPRPRLLTRHASFETALSIYSNGSDIYTHIPSTERSEEPSPRSRSVASIESFVVANPNAKLPPAHPAAAVHRNGVSGMLTSNKRPNSPAKQQLQLNTTSSPTLERSSVNIKMTGGGPESTSSSNQGSQFFQKEAMPAAKRPASRPAVGRYSRIQLPSTKASSRANNRVMTDSLKLYEEQIFSHQISSGQRPLSWCIDVGILDKNMTRTPEENNSSGSPSATNSSSTMSSACSSSSSSNASHAVGPPKIGHLNRLPFFRSGAVFDQSGIQNNPKSYNISPIIHAVRPSSPQITPVRIHSPPVPPGATNRVSSRTRPGAILPGNTSAVSTSANNATSEASTPNANESKNLLTAVSASSGTSKSSGRASSTSTSTSFASSLATVRPVRSDSSPPTPPPAPMADKESSTTLATVRPDDSSPTPSISLLPPPPPWNSDSSMNSNINSSRISNSKVSAEGSAVRQQLFVCPYCRALPTLCRCSASLNSASTTDEGPSFDEDSEDEEESTYAFSSLDSDFIAWMRLSVRNVTPSHPCYSSHQAEALAALTRQEVANIVGVFNSNTLGLRMSLAEGTSKLVGTIRVYINLIKPVKMSLRQTMRHMPQQSSDCAAVPDRLISFFLPRGGSRLLQLSGSTSAQEVIQCLLDRFHIQESASKFALYEHTLETQTILSRKLPPSERPLSMLMHWVRSALATGEEFAVAIRRKRIVLQENENWEVNWSDFTPAELMNFLRILEKEEAEYRNAIYFQYGLVRQQIEQRMAQLSAHDRLLAARHSVAACPPPEQLICPPSPSTAPSNNMQMQHASL
ncbi:hypothetical protein Aperf_G00000037733 [Anoplocephala perfoliata]